MKTLFQWFKIHLQKLFPGLFNKQLIAAPLKQQLSNALINGENFHKQNSKAYEIIINKLIEKLYQETLAELPVKYQNAISLQKDETLICIYLETKISEADLYILDCSGKPFKYIIADKLEKKFKQDGMKCSVNASYWFNPEIFCSFKTKHLTKLIKENNDG